MRYDRQESSRQSGLPIECYQFQYGAGPNDYFGYTNADDPVSFAGLDFRPTPLNRDSVKAGQSLDKQQLEIKLPYDEGICNLFRVYPPSRVVRVTIWAGHGEGIATNDDTLDEEPNPVAREDEFRVVFKGRVLSYAAAARTGKLSCESIQTSMRRSGLRQHYQVQCPHVLYGDRCRAIPDPQTAIVAETDGTRVRVAPGWNQSRGRSDQFTGGQVSWPGDDGNTVARSIYKVLGENEFLFGGPTTDLRINDEISLLLGCGHTMRDCESLFLNVLNFGGFPWIPLESPFGNRPF